MCDPVKCASSDSARDDINTRLLSLILLAALKGAGDITDCGVKQHSSTHCTADTELLLILNLLLYTSSSAYTVATSYTSVIDTTTTEIATTPLCSTTCCC